MSLNGKHALITGSSRGIGRGIALKLAASGAKVAGPQTRLRWSGDTGRCEASGTNHRHVPQGRGGIR